MRSKFLKAIGAIALVGAIAVCGSIYATADESEQLETAKTCASGKHCRYTVGCSCSGFKPLKRGTVYDKTKCDRCGHPRSYHN